MNPNPEIKEISPKLFVGLSTTTSLAVNKTIDLWKAFMPRKKEIKNLIDSNLYSFQTYPPGYDGNPNTNYEMTVAAEVSDFELLPDGLEGIEFTGGRYAIFTHKGTAQQFYKNMGYIYNQWLPQSGEIIDNRPQVTMMGAKYLGENNPNSEEEIWIPIK